MSTVFVVSDLSPASDEAIRQGAERAIAAGATLIVCHVIPAPAADDPLLGSLRQQLGMELPDLQRRIREELTQRIADLGGGKAADFEVMIESGTPHAVVLEKAETLGVGLIVVGAPPALTFGQLFVGSAAEQIIRHAHCPVLVARPRPNSGTVLVATDLSDPALPAVTAAAEEVHRTGARLAILHSIDLTWPVSLHEAFPLSSATLMAAADLGDKLRHQVEERLEAALAHAAVAGERVVVDGPAAQAILQVATDRRADLIVMGTIGRTGLKRALLGSVAEAVVRHAPCSVLVVRLTRADG